MNTLRILVCLAFIGGLGAVRAQTFDISSGGTPTITGSSGGSVTGSSSTTANLTVTINFGEVSAFNTSNIVKVVVPIGIRSVQPYRVTATLVGGTNVDLQGVQRTDVGFGANNLRRMGAQALVCTNSPHIFYPPFNNDPSTGVTLNAAGRATYTSSLNNIGVATTILSGPRLSRNNANRIPVNLYIFDAIFTITPQFYAPGTTTATITFTISAGPNVPC